ncbi:MAG: tetratricopeptide repeat protein [Proteobacteria bacterium]|nr:tetratricopeptide repeat protein [Pseudomonadota bacterium]
MTTIISGQLGKAAHIRGDMCTLIDVDQNTAPLEARFSALRPLFSAAEDLQLSPLTSTNRIREALRSEWQKDRALLLTLMTCDGELDEDLRNESVPLANELLELPAVSQFVLYMLHAKPIDIAVLSEAQERTDKGSPLYSIFHRTIENGATLEVVSHQWSALRDHLFTSDVARKEIRAVCVKAGVFYHLANALRSNSSVDFNRAKFDAALALKGLPKNLEIIAQWMGPLKPGMALKPTRQKFTAEDEDEDYRGADFSKEGKLTPYQRYRRVQDQLPGIQKNLQKLRMDVVRSYANQIVRQQLDQNDDEYAAKTLCNIAQLANDCYQFSYAYELVKRATEVYSADPVAWAMLADANIRLSRYDDAASALEECRRLGRVHYASNGFGRILRHQGRLIEAKEKFEEVVTSCQGDPELFNTYLVLGELYRDLGEYESAASLYERAVAEFSHEPHLLCSQGFLFCELGKFDEAVAIFQRSFELHGVTSQGCLGLASALRAKGELKQAFDANEVGVRRFANESFLFKSKAEILREMQRHREAINVYEHMEEQFAFDHSGPRGHIDTLIELGRFSDALKLVRRARGAFPSEGGMLRMKEVTILQKSSRADEALALAGELANEFPLHVGIKFQTAELLKQLGQLQPARNFYDRLISEHPHVEALRVSSAAISVAMGDFDSALKGMRALPPRTQTEWVGEHVRGMALLRQGHVAAALELFKRGSESVPFSRQKAYFRTALALTQIKARQVDQIDPEAITSNEPVGNIIRLHVYALRNQMAKARVELAALKDCPPAVVPLRDELASQMNLRSMKPLHDSTWVFSQEVAALALAPTYDIAA